MQTIDSIFSGSCTRVDSDNGDWKPKHFPVLNHDVPGDGREDISNQTQHLTQHGIKQTRSSRRSSTLQIQKESPPDCSPCYLVQLGESRNIHTPLAVLIHLSKSLEISLHLCGINFLEVLLPSRGTFWREDPRSSSF